MKSETIERIRKRYKKEWLLIAVDQVDEARTIPLTGHLLAHSPWRSGLDKAVAKNIRLELLTTYTADKLPRGKVFAL